MKTEEISIYVDAKNNREALGDFYGIFFEDINHAADGGLYAEMVQNREFEFSPLDNTNYRPLTTWEKIEEDGRLEWMVTSSTPRSKKTPHYLVLDVKDEGDRVGIRNTGYNGGMAFRKEDTYCFSCYMRSTRKEAVSVETVLAGVEDKAVGSCTFSVGNVWELHELKIRAKREEPHGHLEILIKGKGRLEVDFVSLMPEDTFRGRKNGMRKDIAQMLADMKPKFMRFPGGCLIHDGALEEGCRDSMYRWKNTIGEITERLSRKNHWDYNQSMGIGFFEYFQFCEDIGAEPLPVLPAGCNPHTQEAVPMDEIGPWVQDALDLIEFANGDKGTIWGKIRSELGHPEPFQMKYIGIGNEEVDVAFWERYEVFHQTIRKIYPEIKIINSAGPFCAGQAYEAGWDSARRNGSDLIDEHYYQAPEWFIANHHHYDDYNEKTKVFLGEYASCGNSWRNAIAEAVYMIGLEKNAKAVGMACYAPLLANAAYVDWKPDLIWFDNQRVFGSASYFVQKLFMNFQGSYRLTCTGIGVDARIPMEAMPDRFAGKICLAGYQGGAVFSNIMIENTDSDERMEMGQAAIDEGEKYLIGDIDWKNFNITFEAWQPKEGWGFDCFLGYENNENYFSVNLGGWQNHDLFLSARKNGAPITFTQTSFHVQPNKKYYMKMKVRGRTVSVFINGKQMLQHECKPFYMEPLYYTASRHEDGDIIVKLANITEQERDCRIFLEGAGEIREAEVWQMGGYKDGDANTFENPYLIMPKRGKLERREKRLNYRISGRSIAVLKLKGESKAGVC